MPNARVDTTDDSPLFSKNEAIQALIQISNELEDMAAIEGLLNWDQEVLMPPNGIKSRSHQLSTMSGIFHERITSNKVRRAIYRAKSEIDRARDKFTVYDLALVRELEGDFRFATSLPEAFVRKEAEFTSIASQVWQKARAESNFKIFLPYLEEIFTMARQKADYLGYQASPYNALLDLFEPGLTVKQVEAVFVKVKQITKSVLDKIAKSQTTIDDEFLKINIPNDNQWDLGIQVLNSMGFNFQSGRQDKSTHPFCNSFGGPYDVRITTRFEKDSFIASLFSTVHEAGHALYEQGIDERLTRTVLASGASMAIHESQSRFWENFIARSFPFWFSQYPYVRRLDDRLEGVDSFQFYRAINKVQPGFIRVNADEITYNLHIILRFEIENDLLEGKIKARDLPEIWNSKMQEYLGITPPDDARGVLQDVHWSSGLIGYFPTYTLGNLYAAQIYYHIKEFFQNKQPLVFESFINGRDFSKIRDFLRENIHCYGSTYEPADLIRKLTGQSLDPSYFETYLNEKFSQIYQF